MKKLIAGIVLVLTIAVTAVMLNRKRVVKQMTDENRLSENFTLSEFIKTATGYDNIPGPAERENIRQLVINILQPLRTATGKPVKITSGYRSQLVNMAVGGAGNSQHVTGQAADIQVEGMTNQDIISVMRALRLPYDQVIDEVNGSKQWVHVSYRSDSQNRGNWLTYRNGTYTTISKNYA